MPEPFLPRRLTLRNRIALGLLAVLVAVLGVVVTVQRARIAEARLNPVALGFPVASVDGWGFNLEPSLIPVKAIRSGGPSKDGIPALTDPDYTTAGEATMKGEVIGIELGGEARAYPLGILRWHEIINDTLGDIPIAVSYCPLCDSAFAFRREIGGQVREFGVSGLLFQSNVLMYDRQLDPHDESLWSQIQMRAVTGPAAAAGLELEWIDSSFTDWEDWRTRHPETTVVSRHTSYQRNYDQNPYAGYFRTEELYFPVEGGTQRRPDLGPKDRIIVLKWPDAQKAYPLRDLRAVPGGEIRDVVDGHSVTLRLRPDSRDVQVDVPDGTPRPARGYAFWFAWDAEFPDTPVHGATQ